MTTNRIKPMYELWQNNKPLDSYTTVHDCARRLMAGINSGTAPNYFKVYRVMGNKREEV